ncbi:MAG: EthD family reductase [Salinisphaera sp.]|nr:EthD family reductase [Salinisphaera sp.]
MYSLYAVWSRPEEPDIDDFESHYTATHAPLAARVPNLIAFMTTRTSDGLEDGDPAFYRVAEMSFDSKQALEEAETSPEWTRLRQDAGSMIERFGVTMSVAIGTPDQDNREPT